MVCLGSLVVMVRLHGNAKHQIKTTAMVSNQVSYRNEHENSGMQLTSKVPVDTEARRERVPAMQLDQSHRFGYLARLQPAGATTAMDPQTTQLFHPGHLIEEDGMNLRRSPRARSSRVRRGGIYDDVAGIHTRFIDFDQSPVDLMFHSLSRPSPHAR